MNGIRRKPCSCCTSPRGLWMTIDRVMHWRGLRIAKLRSPKYIVSYYNYFMTTTIYYLFCRQIYIRILAFVMVYISSLALRCTTFAIYWIGPCCCPCGAAWSTTSSGPSRSGRRPSSCSWASSSFCGGVYWDPSVLRASCPSVRAKK